MTHHLRRVLLPFAFALAAMTQAAEPPIIAKARAYLGSEAVLNAVNSVHYVGTLLAPDPADPSKRARTTVEIVFQRPDQQRITSTSEKVIETTALDGYEAWMQLQDAKDASKRRLSNLGVDQVKRLRANTWENLAFFRGIEAVGGKLEDQGTHTIDGVTCQKLAFIHGPNIIFYRYFDVATGRLVLTETEGGGTIREEGEIVVSGIRFPRRIVTTAKTAKGDMHSVTIDFEKVQVNETFPAAQFRVPAPSR